MFVPTQVVQTVGVQVLQATGQTVQVGTPKSFKPALQMHELPESVLELMHDVQLVLVMEHVKQV